MPYSKRDFRFPYPNEEHSILWELAGIPVMAAIIKSAFEYSLRKHVL